jgi:hypothetical protein
MSCSLACDCPHIPEGDDARGDVLRLDEPFADEPADTNAAFLVLTMLLAVAYPSAALLDSFGQGHGGT